MAATSILSGLGSLFSAPMGSPQSNFLSGLAAGLLQGNPVGQRRATLGEGLSRGLLLGMQGYSQGMHNQRYQDVLEMQREELEMKKRAEANKQAVLNAQQTAKSALGAAISGLPMSGPQAMSFGASQGSVGPTVANAQRMQGGPGGFSQSLVPLALAAGYSVDDVQKMSSMRDWGRPEVGNFFDRRNPDGSVTRAGTTKYGDVVDTGAVPFKDRSVVDLGGHLYLRDPVTEALTPLGKKSMTPGEEASNRLGWANNAVSRGNLAVSQGNLDLSRQRLAFDQQQPRGQVMEGPNGPLIVDPRTGMARPVMMGTGVPGMSDVPGMSAQTQPVAPRSAQSTPLDGAPPQLQMTPVPSKEQAKRSRDSEKALAIVGEAEKLLDQATGSWIGAGVDFVGNVFGGSTPGALAGAQLKALEAQLILNQPRLEGPQSDKDTALYQRAAAMIGDPTVPASQKRAALQVVRNLHEQALGVPNTTGKSANEPSPPAWADHYVSQRAAVQDARRALMRGAPKAQVIRRLEEMGITNHGLK